MHKIKKRITKWAFSMHGILGLTCGFFYLLLGLSGSLLMFRHSLDRYFNQDLHSLAPTSPPLSVDSLYRIVAERYPNLEKIVIHDFPVDRHDSYEFMLYMKKHSLYENHLSFAILNPYNGKVLKEGSYQEISPSFFRWLYSFHYNLQLGAPGQAVTALLGMLMLCSLATGIIVYRKHFLQVLLFRTRLNLKKGRRGFSSVHRVIGVWGTLLNTLLFFTGLWMNFPALRPVTWYTTPGGQSITVTANIDSLISKCKNTIKGFEPIAVNIPTTKGQDILVRGRLPGTSFFLLQGKASNFSFDPQTGVMKELTDIEKQSFSKQLSWAIYQLHIGAYGGNIIRWLYILLGLSPGILTLTGIILWYKRKY